MGKYERGQFAREREIRIVAVLGVAFLGAFCGPARETSDREPSVRCEVDVAQSLGPLVNSPAFDGSPTVSADETELFFTSERKGQQDLFVSTRPDKDAAWTESVSLGAPIDDPTAGDFSLRLSADGKALYFASTRAGGFGKADMYVATRASKQQVDELRQSGLRHLDHYAGERVGRMERAAAGAGWDQFRTRGILAVANNGREETVFRVGARCGCRRVGFDATGFECSMGCAPAARSWRQRSEGDDPRAVHFGRSAITLLHVGTTGFCCFRGLHTNDLFRARGSLRSARGLSLKRHFGDSAMSAAPSATAPVFPIRPRDDPHIVAP